VGWSSASPPSGDTSRLSESSGVLLVRRAGGTSGSHQRVRPDDTLSIDVPDINQLDSSAKRRALALLDLIQHRRVESTRLGDLCDVLLPELLSGRIRVPEAREVVEAVGSGVAGVARRPPIRAQ